MPLPSCRRLRGRQDKNGLTTVSEGIDSNYMDIINYSVFAVIKLAVE